MDENNNPLIVEMTDENGEKVKVELVNEFEDNGKTYVIANDLSNDTDSYLLELRTSENGDELISIDDEKEFERLCKVVEDLED
jgi:uncharacterized protein YrzB (UPF0473 family)